MKKTLILILTLSVKLGFSQLTSGLLACYPLNCDNATDGGPNGLNGTLNSSGVTCATGHLSVPSTAYHFGGNAADYIILPATTSPYYLKPSTIAVSGWFQSDDLANAYLVYTKNNCTSNFEAYALNFLTPGGLGTGTGGFYVTKSGPGCNSKIRLFQNTNPITGDPIPAANAWTHVVFCIDNSSMSLYINGHLNTSMTHTIAWDYSTSGGILNKDVILGNTAESGYTQSFKGSMDNIRFYDRCLTAWEIEYLYHLDPACDVRGGGQKFSGTGSTVGIEDNLNDNMSVLSQNMPNPFIDVTTINYSIPASVTNASIELYDLVGKKMGTYPLTKGEASLKIATGDLAPGVYIYSIIGDGRVMQSKHMIITK